MAMLVKLWKNRHGYPVMREYQSVEHNPEVKRLTYPNGEGRNYYIPGDCVLTGERTLKELAKSYPEMSRAADEDPGTLESLLEIALVFAGVEKAKYKTAWRIQEMYPTHVTFPGDGWIVMQHLVLLDENTPIPLGSPYRWSMVDLNWSWRMKETAAQMERDLLPMIDAAVTLAEIGVTFGTSTVTKVIASKVKRKAAKLLIKRGLLRVLRVALKVLSKAVIKATLAAIKAFATEVARQVMAFNEAQRLRQFSGQAAKSHDWKVVIITAAPLAATAFIVSLLDAVRQTVFKKIDKFIGEALGLAPDLLETKIKAYVLKEVVDVFTTGAVDLLTRAVSNAVTASLDSAGRFDEGKFGRQLVIALSDQLSSLLVGKLKGIPEAVGEQLTDLVAA
jgi:hypothetical protein